MAEYPRANPARWWKTRSVGSVHRSPAAMFVSPLRNMMSVSVLAVLIGLIGGVWFLTNPDRMSRMAQLLLSRVLGGRVIIRNGYLSMAGTLRLSGVELKTGPELDAAHTLFQADQLEVRFTWISLLSGNLNATEITALRPSLNLVENRDTDRWNYQEMAVPTAVGDSGSNLSGGLPVIILRNAQVLWAEVSKNQYTQTGRTVVDGQLQPDSANPSRYLFQIVQQQSDPELRRGSDPLLSGTWDISTNAFRASIRNVALSTGVRKTLPRQVREWWDRYRFSGTLSRLDFLMTPQQGPSLRAELGNVSMVVPILDEEIPFENVSGQLAFDPHQIQINDFHGRVQGFDFNLKATIDGYSPEAASHIELRLPMAQIPLHYPRIVDKIPVTNELAERLHPSGPMNIEVNVHRPKAGGRVLVTGSVECVDVDARFAHFPFPLQHVRGMIRFDQDYLEFVTMEAIAESYKVHLKGRLGIPLDNDFCDFRVWADALPFDDRLRGCLSDKFQIVWDLFNPLGVGGFECRVTRPMQGQKEPNVHCEVFPRDVKATFGPFPYPLEHLQGSLVFEDDQTLIRKLTATIPGAPAGAEVELRGVISHPHGDLENMDPQIQIRASHVPLDPTLLLALPEDYREYLTPLAPRGILDLEAAISPGENHAPQVTGRIHITQGQLHPAGMPWSLDQLTVDAQIQPRGLQIMSFQGRLPTGGKLEASGLLEQNISATRLQCSGSWSGLTLFPQPPEILPESWAAMWKTYQPSGSIDGHMDMDLEIPKAPPRRSLPRREKHLDYQLELLPHQVTLKLPGWKEPLGAINGQVRLTPQIFSWDKLTAATGPLTAQSSGRYLLDDESLQGTLQLKAESFSPLWLEKLPVALRQSLEKLQLEGGFELSVPKLARQAQSSGGGWSFGGELKSPRISASGGAAKAHGFALSLEGQWDQGLDLDGRFTVDRVDLGDRKISGLSARVSTHADRRELLIKDLDGVVAGGNLFGQISFAFTDPVHYKASMVLNDADVARLVLAENATAAERKKFGTGRLTASLAFQGDLGEKPNRTGRGNLIVREGTIYNVPLAMGLLQLATLRLPLSRAFEQARMSYHLRDNCVTFEQILLSSSGVNLAGIGKLQLSDQTMDLQFVTESPDPLNIPLFRELLQEARAQLLQLHIYGPVENPTVHAVPFNALTSTLKSLLPGKK